MSSHITISVRGTSGAGKSALVQVILEALATSGLFRVKFINPEHELRSAQDLQAILREMGDRGTTVAIEENHVRGPHLNVQPATTAKG